MKLTGTLAEKGFHAFDAEPHTHAGHEIPRLWIVVADRMKARIYRKTHDKLELIGDAVASSGASHLGKAENYKVARAIGSGGGHGQDPRQENKHHEDMAFIHTLTSWLEDAEREKAFDRLALVAAPHTLGEIRSVLSKSLQARVTTEINKDLTKLPENELRDHLKDVVWF